MGGAGETGGGGVNLEPQPRVHGDRCSLDVDGDDPVKLSMDASTFRVLLSATVDSFSVSWRWFGMHLGATNGVDPFMLKKDENERDDADHSLDRSPPIVQPNFNFGKL